MDISYALTPILAWAFTGLIKFIVNCLRYKRFAFDLIGYGGMPSNHSAIVSSTLFIVIFKEGIQSAAFAVALTLVFIVILDASSLRKHIEKQSVLINKLTTKLDNRTVLRERIGHTKVEIFIGIIAGLLVSSFVYFTNYLFIF